MLDTFILRAIAAGVGVAMITGVIGCFVVWRRMAYFGDSLAHSALLGISLGLAAGIGTNPGVIIVCSLFAALLLWMQQKKVLATDTLLGILAHAALSIGMVTISVLGQRVDLHSYLFGDILTITPSELWWIYIGGAVVLIMLLMNWSSLVLMTIHEDLAKAENVRTFFTHLLLTFLMTIVVAVSIRTVGILLITSMLIIPAATARQLVYSPEAMAITASLLGIAAVIIGILGSVKLDTPSGPSIVVASAVLFAVLFPVFTILSQKRSWRR
jgi:zinc transport system permease protein